MIMKKHIARVLSGHNLTLEESSNAMTLIMKGEATPVQIAGLIIALKQKGETVDEVAGFVDAMRSHSVKVELSDDSAVDGCGTGGDGSHSFNISTAAALVAAGAGAKVAKHGNRAISSSCGSADILEACGANIDPGPEIVTRCINKVGFGFMFAPRFHPAMKHAAAPRKELGVRTIFNILGPMTNPAGVKRQVVGVYDPRLMSLMAEVLQKTGSVHVLVAHSHDGMDEFSVTAPTDYVELHNDTLTTHTTTPESVGLTSYPDDVVFGGDAAHNLKILYGLLDGERSGCRDAVIFNAGAMLYVACKAGSIAEGVQLAATAIDNGAARKKLEDWIEASKS